MNYMPPDLPPLPSNMASFSEAKKCHKFRCAALSILANGGEMDADALREAVMKRMGVNSDGIFGELRKNNFAAHFYVTMSLLAREQSVIWEMKRSSNPERDAELKKLSRAHFSITEHGRAAKVKLSEEAVASYNSKKLWDIFSFR